MAMPSKDVLFTLYKTGNTWQNSADIFKYSMKSEQYWHAILIVSRGKRRTACAHYCKKTTREHRFHKGNGSDNSCLSALFILGLPSRTLLILIPFVIL